MSEQWRDSKLGQELFGRLYPMSQVIVDEMLEGVVVTQEPEDFSIIWSGRLKKEAMKEIFVNFDETAGKDSFGARYEREASSGACRYCVGHQTAVMFDYTIGGVLSGEHVVGFLKSCAASFQRENGWVVISGAMIKIISGKDEDKLRLEVRGWNDKV